MVCEVGEVHSSCVFEERRQFADPGLNDGRSHCRKQRAIGWRNEAEETEKAKGVLFLLLLYFVERPTML